MAKKKENKLSYMQMPLPEGFKYSKMVKRSWSGLNRRQVIDTGALSMENNISTAEAPYLTPSQKWDGYKKYDVNTDEDIYPICMSGFNDFLVVVYSAYADTDTTNQHQALFVDYITKKGDVYTGVLKDKFTQDDDYPRSIVQFNVYDMPTNSVLGTFNKKLLIFPDRKSMDFEITKDDFEIKDMNAEVETYTNETPPYLPPDGCDKTCYWQNTYNENVYLWIEDTEDDNNSGWEIRVPPGGPPIKYATVHLSRVFGVDDDRVYASGYNDYSNWSYDTVDEYNESNAWCSPAQSNTKAGGKFTGITTFQNHVICFKRDFMHEIYNTKNPFRIQDIYAEGTIDNRTIQDVDGRLIFVSDDGVKIYTGSNPRVIDYYLNNSKYDYAVSGTDGQNYYLYCECGEEKTMFTYDTVTECWSQQNVPSKVLSFAHNKNGMYALCDDGYIYKMDTGLYADEWCFETDMMTNQTVDIKHLKKMQMFAEIGADASIEVYAVYNDGVFDEEASHLLYSFENDTDKTVQKAIRVKPRQTANYGFKLHVKGSGYVRLYELELHVQAGGELYG